MAFVRCVVGMAARHCRLSVGESNIIRVFCTAAHAAARDPSGHERQEEDPPGREHQPCVALKEVCMPFNQVIHMISTSCEL
jgi:hypothetical protein